MHILWEIVSGGRCPRIVNITMRYIGHISVPKAALTVAYTSKMVDWRQHIICILRLYYCRVNRNISADVKTSTNTNIVTIFNNNANYRPTLEIHNYSYRAILKETGKEMELN